MTWLVTGGAGYIGSHVMHELKNEGHLAVGLDNMSNTDGSRLNNKFPLIVGDIRDLDLVRKCMKDYKITGVVHLAGLKSPEESLSKSQLYFDVNQLGTQNLIKVAIESRVPYFIQSSTAAVYGDSHGTPIKEYAVLKPQTPYGASKAGAESALDTAIQNDLILGMSLRYFNVVGSAATNLKDTSKNNLFPRVIESVRNSNPPVIFGSDYPTRDGSCIRDYIHVKDIATGHLAAIKKLEEIQGQSILNLGTGIGYSVKEITTGLIDALDSKIQPIIGPRRDGDPASVIADISLAKELLGFSATESLQEMIQTSI